MGGERKDAGAGADTGGAALSARPFSAAPHPSVLSYIRSAAGREFFLDACNFSPFSIVL